MIKRTLTALLFAAVLAAPQAWAADAPPFVATTITAGHEFATNTKWYTIQLGNAGFYLGNPGQESFIEIGVSRLPSITDDYLWCFVGNDTDGYRIYNKAAGATKVLAAPAVTGDGGQNYAILKPANALDGYSDQWVFSTSNALGGRKAFFLNVKGQSSWKLNNRGEKLAFWTGGADHGSSFVITAPGEGQGGEVVVSPTTGTLTGSNPNSAYKSLWTSTTGIALKLNAGVNNMNVVNGILQLHSGSAGRGSYVLEVPVGFKVKSAEFDIQLSSASDNISIEANGTSTKATAEKQHISLTNTGETSSLSFQVVGQNKPLKITDFKVVVEKAEVKQEAQQNLFVYKYSTPVTYRIPAIAVTGKSGTIVAVSDSRHTGLGDVGNGRIDLFATRSKDNGLTWDTPEVFKDAAGNPVAQGTGKKVDNDVNKSRDAGYGDAAVVADRESDDVLVLSVSGYTPFFSARRNTPNAIARWYSKDAGKTFTAHEDVTEDIYKLFDGTTQRGHVESIFFGSGRIVQSHRTKVGSHYRLYGVMVGLNVNPQTLTNWAMYSDDFGKTWHILGDPMTPPIPESANEPKCEELPDGSIVVSSRRSNGRWFNVFRFTDTEKGQGYWETMTYSPLVKASANDCNGEMMVVPVVKKATGEKMYLALQSVPFGPSGRTNVGINYKELAGYEDFGTVANFSKDWDGAHMSSQTGSAYSVMAWQKNDRLAFMYEEETFAPATKGGYTQVYKNYSIEDITGGAYSYAPDADFKVANTLRDEVVKTRLAEVKKTVGNNVGQLSEEAFAGIELVANTYLNAPSAKLYEAFNTAVKEAPRNEVQEKMLYSFRNDGYKHKGQPSYYLQAATGNKLSGTTTYDAANDAFHFSFVSAGKPGQYYLYNEQTKTYVMPLQAQNVAIGTTETMAEAGVFELQSLPSGEMLLHGLNAKQTNIPYLHLAGDQSLVSWTSSEPSRWFIAPVGRLSAIKSAEATNASAAEDAVRFDLSGRRVSDAHKGIVITKQGKSVK